MAGSRRMAGAGLYRREGRMPFPASSAVLLETWPTIDNWTQTSSPTVTGGQDDPFGGTSAAIVQDDSATAIESVTRTGAVSLVSGQRYRITIYVKKDAVNSVTRVVEAQIKANTSFVFLNLDTSTGAVASRSTGGFTSVSLSAVESPTGWWKVVTLLTSNVAAAVQTVLIPAVGAGAGVPVTSSAGTTGSTTFYPLITLERL